MMNHEVRRLLIQTLDGVFAIIFCSVIATAWNEGAGVFGLFGDVFLACWLGQVLYMLTLGVRARLDRQ